jgi:2-polyprenyl-6-methoxyphenol hydroxylase-like FAD-dependent oxidoreductase
MTPGADAPERGVSMDGRIVVIGSGIGGLSTALALGRAGHEVLVLERDALPTSGDAEEAFAAERRGAPQAHQTHGFLARLVVEMRRHFPDVLASLYDVGCVTVPARNNLGEPQPGDEDLAVLIVRRTTLEWLLREAALAQPGVELRPSCGIAGLSHHVEAGVPVIDGVRLEDGRCIPASLVVDASGRRSTVPAMLAGVGVELHEEIHESGLMYLSRWYRVPDGIEVPLDEKLGGDLGHLKFLAVPGDGRTLSITLAVRVADGELRTCLADPDGFERAVRLLEGPSRFFASGPLEPIGSVRPMAGLLNRTRRFLDDDGAPRVLGLHAVGDSHTCTNPLYGRGCSLALVQALLLADALATHGDDATARATAYEAACGREIEPWYHSSVEMDIAGADPGLADGATERPPDPMARVFVAAETDPVIGRALTRMMNLLATPAELATDGEFTARVAAILADPAAYPVPPRPGPTRRELLDALAGSAV